MISFLGINAVDIFTNRVSEKRNKNVLLKKSFDLARGTQSEKLDLQKGVIWGLPVIRHQPPHSFSTQREKNRCYGKITGLGVRRRGASEPQQFYVRATASWANH